MCVRSCTSGGDNPPPRPFSECALVFGARVIVEIGSGAPAHALARAAVWCKGYCGNW